MVAFDRFIFNRFGDIVAVLYAPTQGLFPAGTPGNGVPNVIFTAGTAFPGIQ